MMINTWTKIIKNRLNVVGDKLTFKCISCRLCERQKACLNSSKHLSGFLWIGLLLCFTLDGASQNGLPVTLGAKSIAMGNTGVAFNDVQAILNNPAGLTSLSSLSLIIAAEQRFAISELQSLAAGVAFPGRSGIFGLSLQHFGFDLYNEQRIGLTYARSLSDHFSVGAQLIVHNTSIEEYGSKWTPAVELGFLYEITAYLHIGVHIFNPARIEIIEGEYLPTVLRLGFSYRSSENVLFAAEINKDIDFPVQVRAGLEYQLAKPLFFRVGMQTAPEKWSSGIGYQLENQALKIDFSVAHHQFLGFSPAISLSYSLE